MNINNKNIILIVDDNPTNLKILFDLLAASGFKVLVAEDGESAIEKIEYAMPDIILLDVLMPGIDGFETCIRLKENKLTQHIPVIFMTALNNTVDKVKGLNLGAVDYITKPLQHEEVLARVNIHLRLRNLTKKLTEQNLCLEQEISERKRVEEDLRRHTAELTEWKNRYEALIQASGQILYDWDSHTNDVMYDGDIERILGYSTQEMAGGLDRWFDLIHPLDKKLFKAGINRVLLTKEPFHMEFRICRKDGEYITVEDNGYFFLDSAGNLSRMVGFVIDISDAVAAATQRKQAEEEREQAFKELQKSEARFRCLVESNIMGIMLADLSGKITEANDTFLKMVGYEPEELISGKLSWDKLTPPEYRHLDERAIAELISHEVCTPFEKEFICKNGSRLPVLMGGAMVEPTEQKAVCFVLDISDAVAAATQRKQADSKIREQAALLDITTDAILVRDRNNKIIFWNKAAECLYGWKTEEAIGKDANHLLYKEPYPQLKKNQEIVAEKGEWQGELHQVTQDGRNIIVASRWTLVRDEDGQPKFILTVNTDITEKKQLEAQFLRAQRMESIGTLASGIAHDLNNSLSPILISVQLLKQKLQDDQSQRLLKILETNTKRSADLVKQVLSFARGIEGKRTTLQAGHLILEIEQIIKQTFPKNIEIHTDIPTLELWSISADATQLHQVLMNLCVNARDAMPNGGILEISARNIWIDDSYARMNLDAKIGPYVVITVADTGMGIPAEMLERIFEPFFTTKELGKGTGLGLSTAIGIIKSHEGFVKVFSELAKGTQFKVYLPATDTAITADITQPSYELPRGDGELILVVDDEDTIRETTKISLETYDYKVLSASDGIEAIALYAQHKEDINLVLLDIMMPSMDGITAIRTLQKINPAVKIIAVSGLSSNSQISEAVGSNIKTFLSKPYTSEELVKNVQMVISKK